MRNNTQMTSHFHSTFINVDIVCPSQAGLVRLEEMQMKHSGGWWNFIREGRGRNLRLLGVVQYTFENRAQIFLLLNCTSRGQILN